MSKINAKIKDNYYLLSLGCSKNTVDSESMAQVLGQSGLRGVGDPNKAEVLIVNTCGFIDAAKEESINALKELVEGKKGNQMVIAAGCLSQRYGADLVQYIPGLDGVIGTRRWMDIFDLVTRLRDRKHPEPLLVHAGGRAHHPLGLSGFGGSSHPALDQDPLSFRATEEVGGQPALLALLLR